MPVTSISRIDRFAIWLALAVPVAALGGALVSQYVFGLYPCEMCYWQRWPHWGALALAIPALSLLALAPGLARVLASAAAIAILISGLIGGFHAGVEYGWWEGVTACTSTVGGGQDVLSDIMNAPVIRCDQPQWTLGGISLAGFNFLLSVSAGIVILILLWSKRKTTIRS